MILLPMGGEIGLSAISPDFLRPGPQNPNRAARLPGIHDSFSRRRDDRDSGGIVVDGAGARIPVVEMPGDEDDPCLRVAARRLGDGISRFPLAREPARSPRTGA